MKKIEVGIINPLAVCDAENMMVAMARLTQRGEKITSMNDLMDLIHKDHSIELVQTMCALPHPTIQKFGLIHIAIVGASRRFLGQITRHQNEVKFMSGSLQYSDYSDVAQFCVPYEITVFDEQTKVDGEAPIAEKFYLDGCLRDLAEYNQLAQIVGRDAAGYKMPQGMRNVVIISATPYQWKHMIGQRVCNRNTLETKYVLLRCWEELIKISPMYENCGAACSRDCGCTEGKMACGRPVIHDNPGVILDHDFFLIRGGNV